MVMVRVIVYGCLVYILYKIRGISIFLVVYVNGILEGCEICNLNNRIW